MKALILNSGMGKRMGVLTSEHPKCMTEISPLETILSRQLRLLQKCGLTDIVLTTGLFDDVLVDYCTSLNLPLQFTYVNNPRYDSTNYIYSIYLARQYLDDDILLLHGDLVFEQSVLQDVLKQSNSCMTVSSTIPLPLKDFKAVIQNHIIHKIGIEYFENAVAAQPLYKINKETWKIWMNNMIKYCESGQESCYAENAFNEVSNSCIIYPLDYTNRLCVEIDTPEDLSSILLLMNQNNY